MGRFIIVLIFALLIAAAVGAAYVAVSDLPPPTRTVTTPAPVELR